MSRAYFSLIAAGVLGMLACPGPTSAFDCSPAQCPDIQTCAEAKYKLDVCGHSERDADSDGIPCEALCGDSTALYAARARIGWPDTLPFQTRAEPAPEVQGFIGKAEAAEPAETGEFACAGKRTCKQMTSCEEATFYLRQCGARSLDRNGDGVPCESLCR